MKNLCASLIILSFSLYSQAGIDSLYIIRILAESLYNLGDDNNYLDTATINAEYFRYNESQELTSQDEIISTIKQCVFMQKGAYGEHMSDDLQDRIAQQMAFDIKNNIKHRAIYKTPMAQVEMGSGLFNAPCVMAIEDLDLSKVLLVQGAAMD
jgi:hypothetical protein